LRSGESGYGGINARFGERIWVLAGDTTFVV